MPIKKHQDYIYDALSILIDISKNAQQSRGDLWSHLSKGEWLIHCCTIKVSCSRRTGHTDALSRLVKEDGLNLGAIFGNSDMRNMFPDQENLVFSHTVHDFEAYLRYKNYDQLDGVVVDTSYLMSEKKKSTLYSIINSMRHISINKPFYIIFLQ